MQALDSGPGIIMMSPAWYSLECLQTILWQSELLTALTMALIKFNKISEVFTVDLLVLEDTNSTLPAYKVQRCFSYRRQKFICTKTILCWDYKVLSHNWVLRTKILMHQSSFWKNCYSCEIPWKEVIF